MYDINKRLAELLQVPEVDFKSDARLVIEAMRKREDWHRFVAHKVGGFIPLFPEIRYLIPVDLIMDRSGKLTKLATEWLKERSK